MSGCHGFLLVDKPAGLTSFGVVDVVRRTLIRSVPGLRPRGKQRFKCGHAGSLDPLATGLLVLMCGAGTRLSKFLTGLDKRYETVVRLGVGTDSHDADGAVTETTGVSVGPDDLIAALEGFRGEQDQIPPIYSAVKRDGRRMYALARGGEDVPELEPRRITVSRLEAEPLRWGEPAAEGEPVAADGLAYDFRMSLDCSSGTYVRSLARDLAVALGTVGHVRSLRRERIGPFPLEGAVPPDSLEDGDSLLDSLRPLSEAMPHVPSVTVSAPEADLIRHGGQPEFALLRRLDPPLAADDPPDVLFQIKDERGDLVCVARTGPGLPRTAAVFPALGERRP